MAGLRRRVGGRQRPAARRPAQSTRIGLRCLGSRLRCAVGDWLRRMKLFCALSWRAGERSLSPAPTLPLPQSNPRGALTLPGADPPPPRNPPSPRNPSPPRDPPPPPCPRCDTAWLLTKRCHNGKRPFCPRSLLPAVSRAVQRQRRAARRSMGPRQQSAHAWQAAGGRPRRPARVHTPLRVGLIHLRKFQCPGLARLGGCPRA